MCQTNEFGLVFFCSAAATSAAFLFRDMVKVRGETRIGRDCFGWILAMLNARMHEVMNQERCSTRLARTTGN